MSGDERYTSPLPDDRTDGSVILTYGAPFLGTLLVAVGIAGGTLGGYAVAQSELGLCGNPTIVVYSPAETGQYTGASPEQPALDRFAVAELTPAERRAFEEAVQSPRGVADVRGRFAHRDVFRRGVLVTSDGIVRYATISSANSCLSVDPLLFPLGVVSILLGILGILTPPLYRKLLEREERAGRTSR
ncbi:hypothetical protein ACFFQF_02645 [Haladaptatus pallidirubidus]|uniref:DUF7979 domain-containing protein n=1 Tax=Haladaptatus pallidirubidus TaxID=1008152 RepID=A0AAV3UC25_9EURY|nr:hypothetical protein [Haladaptatus pallidirubidus]